MQVAILSCPSCRDEWIVTNPDPNELREQCRDCNDSLEVEYLEVN